MYIAVEKYRQYNTGIDTIAVLDTTDCTTEIVRREDCDDIAIANLYYYKDANYGGISYVNIFKVLDRYDDKTEFVHSESGNILCVGNKKIHTKLINRRINGVELKIIENIDICAIASVFLFKDYIILRIIFRVYVSSSNKYMSWHTVAVDKEGKVEQWSEDYSVCTNRALAVQVDTVHGW